MIENIIKEVWDGKKSPRNWEDIEGVMVHRCGLDKETGVILGYDAPSICSAFLGRHPDYPEVAKATGGENPYTLYIGGDCGGPKELDGKIWQALPLDEVGYHGRRFSVSYIGIGLIFDGRYAPPSQKQLSSLTDILVELCVASLWDPYKRIKGHGELPKAHNGTKSPDGPAACPGTTEHINMNVLRDEVAILMKDRARSRLHDAGLVFGS